MVFSLFSPAISRGWEEEGVSAEGGRGVMERVEEPAGEWEDVEGGGSSNIDKTMAIFPFSVSF